MKKRSLIALGIASALVLSACGANDSADEATGNGNGEGEVVGGELNIAYNAQPPTLDVVNTTAHAARIMARLVFEPLLDLDANGHVQPVLAEDYEVSDDGLTLTFTLRDDVTFHDGSPMEAADAVASVQRWLDVSIIGGTYFGEAEVDSPEEGIVELTLPQPMYLAPELFADPGQMPYIMPAEVIDAAEADGVQEYVGTGPYVFGTWETDQYLRFDRYEDYASAAGEPSAMAGEKTPYYDEMYIHFVSDDTTRLSGLQTGEYDVASPIDSDNLAALEADPNVELVPGEAGLAFALFNKNEGDSPMADINMRRAVVAAMDTEAMLIAAFTSDEYFSNNSAFMPEGTPWHVEVDPEFEDFYQNQDLDLAAQYLDEAGYDGETITLVASPDYGDHFAQATILQQQLEDAGMNTELVTPDFPTVLEIMSEGTDFEIAFSHLSNWPLVPITSYFFAPDTQGATDDQAIFDATDALVNAADEEEATAAMEELEAAYQDYLPVIKIGDRRTATGTSADLTGFDHPTSIGEIFHHIRPVA